MDFIRFFDLKPGQNLIKWISETVRSLNALAQRSLNTSSGTVTVSETDTTGTVTFEGAEKSSAYRLSVTPVTLTGSPSADSSRVRSISKTTAGFTVTVEAAPGAGTSVSFDWILHRGF